MSTNSQTEPIVHLGEHLRRSKHSFMPATAEQFESAGLVIETASKNAQGSARTTLPRELAGLPQDVFLTQRKDGSSLYWTYRGRIRSQLKTGRIGIGEFAEYRAHFGEDPDMLLSFS